MSQGPQSFEAHCPRLAAGRAQRRPASPTSEGLFRIAPKYRRGAHRREPPPAGEATSGSPQNTTT